MGHNITALILRRRGLPGGGRLRAPRGGDARVLRGINAALRHLGVVAAPGLDEFDTVGLGNHRSFHVLDDRDWDEEYAKLGLERP
jgi:hypothetical protein